MWYLGCYDSTRTNNRSHNLRIRLARIAALRFWRRFRLLKAGRTTLVERQHGRDARRAGRAAGADHAARGLRQRQGDVGARVAEAVELGAAESAGQSNDGSGHRASAGVGVDRNGARVGRVGGNGAEVEVRSPGQAQRLGCTVTVIRSRNSGLELSALSP